MKKALSALFRPFLDAWRGLDRVLEAGIPALAKVFVGLTLGWFLYVPIHELLHAAACLLAGGSVSRLEIAPMYGGALLAKIFPFVVAGGEYAGRLSGFDTRGSDWIYLATDLGPFVLALFPGVWALRRAVAHKAPFFYGLALPVALAPLLSLPGDAYEIGSILTTRFSAWSEPALRTLLRGDDVFQKHEQLSALSNAPWGGFTLAMTIGFVWALATYGLGSLLARALGERPIEPRVLEPKSIQTTP